MTLLSRLLSARALPRRTALAMCFSALCAVVLLAASAPAGALVKSFGGQTYGLTPRSVHYLVGDFEGEGLPAGKPSPATLANENGNPVVHSSAAYAIYWDPTYHYHGDWEQLIDGFFQNFSASSGNFGSVFSVASQYTDRSNQHAAFSSVFRGAYTDTDPYPVLGNCADPHPLLPAYAIACLTDSQVRTELEEFIAQHSLPKGMSSIFYLLTPPGVTVCLEVAGVHCSDSEPPPAVDTHSFCSYHAAISPTSPLSGDANTILYAMIPWSAGGAGDHSLAGNETYAYDCQDGGYDPSSTPVAEAKEKAKERNVKEQEEFEKDSPEEQARIERTRAIEGPHEQEPNQIGLGPDGSFDTGLADLIVGQIAQEQENIVTDPLLNGWQDSSAHEVADECRNKFDPPLGGAVTANEQTEAGTLYNQTLGGTNYYLNNAFNLAAYKLSYPGVACVGGIRLIPSFSVPTAVSSGEILGFNGMESDITLDQGTAFPPAGAPKPSYSTFTWNFGDGSPTVSGFAPGAPGANSPAVSPCQAPWEAPCAASAFHSYTYGGTYQVTLKVTDVGGNTAEVTNPVVVTGPPPPPPPAPPAPVPAPASGSSSSTPAGAGASGGSPLLPGPVARAAASGTSLAQALRRGLLVNYSVNEQVAGRFEILLNSATARRLGVKGRPAVGLPAGTPPSLIVGQALLVTTQGGHSTVRIKFSKRTTERLRHVRKLTLTLRLIVRNAATQNPQSTTVLSTFVLHH